MSRLTATWRTPTTIRCTQGLTQMKSSWYPRNGPRLAQEPKTTHLTARQKLRKNFHWSKPKDPILIWCDMRLRLTRKTYRSWWVAAHFSRDLSKSMMQVSRHKSRFRIVGKPSPVHDKSSSPLNQSFDVWKIMNTKQKQICYRNPYTYIYIYSGSDFDHIHRRPQLRQPLALFLSFPSSWRHFQQRYEPVK